MTVHIRHVKPQEISAESDTRVTRNPRLHFTQKRIESLPLPDSGRVLYHDDEVRGLSLTVYPNGRKVFNLRRKINGVAERVLIGPFGDVTVDDARKPSVHS